MLTEVLMLFIIITFILFILSVFVMEDTPMLAIPLIMCGMIFSILCTYGFWRIDYFYAGYNASHGNASGTMYSTFDYGDPYGYVFVFIFFIFIILFLRAGMNMWKDALETKGEMNYHKRDNRWR